MDNLGVRDQDHIKVTNVTLPKASFVLIQPHETKFIELANPKAVLESALRHYACLSEVLFHDSRAM